MKNYGALRIIAGILKFFGWATIVVGVIFCFVVIFAGNSPYAVATPRAYVVLIAVAVSFVFFLSGILILASGEMIEAVVDIAVNSAKLPEIAVNSSKAAEFYDRMSASAAKRVAT